nr:MAG TPA: Protein of unknown function (DUF4056) [Caudoviricetes sp.]
MIDVYYRCGFVDIGHEILLVNGRQKCLLFT